MLVHFITKAGEYKGYAANVDLPSTAGAFAISDDGVMCHIAFRRNDTEKTRDIVARAQRECPLKGCSPWRPTTDNLVGYAVVSRPYGPFYASFKIPYASDLLVKSEDDVFTYRDPDELVSSTARQEPKE